MSNKTLTSAETAVQEQLNLQVANWTVLYTKLHNFHWYVKGGHFFTLHAKFEELYNEAANYVDELAERLLSIGGRPVATLKESLAMATVAEASGTENAEQMVASIVSDFGKISEELKSGMDAAEEAGDQATADMLLGVKEALDKHVWMLNAFLGK
ncbi:DNA starvation/stationary phase protection protein [Paenibacillus sp. CAA11]|uniref:Dps family protein n=1 Tax=Paenibacillus sp. CAA11 TaxID=1532905 RepID=UPI000D35DF1A|nr:Dps family protein [Paenibacillus sp. CAA11]AWB43603.1 DNA starvation/stationary phase protection protein [Paenibacillus sp. CAA11]